jgi:hypothetical protein
MPAQRERVPLCCSQCPGKLKAGKTFSEWLQSPLAELFLWSQLSSQLHASTLQFSSLLAVNPVLPEVAFWTVRFAGS